MEYAVKVENLSKAYKMYSKSTDRVLEALRLTKKQLYTEFWAVNGISFTLEKGEILGIMGRNGSGKSTLLKMITGVLTPSGGSVEVDGKVASLLELGAGFNLEYSGMENIYFYGTLMGMTSAQMDARVQDIINFAEIGDFVYQPVKTYSSGMFARLAFSCAVNVEPEVLIVDEILSVGDIRFQAKCFNKFKEFKRQGVTILYVGHDIATMRTFCDTCIWMNNGRIMDQGDPAYISSKYTEFMYTDDDSDFTEYKQGGKGAEEADSSGHSEADERGDAPPTPQPAESYEQARDSRQPIAHWGSRKGMIKNISLTGPGGEASHFAPRDELLISFDYDATGTDAADLSLAFSIKNNEGLDYIVRTTHDEGLDLSQKPRGRVSFRLRTLLNGGEYYLVVAAENRKNAVINYYEYIEGARYFKVVNTGDIFGLYLPDVQISAEGN